jgi:hypothetical protein
MVDFEKFKSEKNTWKLTIQNVLIIDHAHNFATSASLRSKKSKVQLPIFELRWW